MAEEIGKIEKPEADGFIGKRKLYVVPLLFQGPNAPEEFKEKFERYWTQVSAQISKLEISIGKVDHIYHESITQAGDAGLKDLEKLHANTHQITKDKCEQGATLEAADDRELSDEIMDWERFLMIGFISQKVGEMVSGFYTEASKKRNEYVVKQIEETLKEKEAGILFVREGHSLQFPPGLEVFSVAPPALDEILRWARDRNVASQTSIDQEETEETNETQPPEGAAQDA